MVETNSAWNGLNNPLNSISSAIYSLSFHFPASISLVIKAQTPSMPLKGLSTALYSNFTSPTLKESFFLQVEDMFNLSQNICAKSVKQCQKPCSPPPSSTSLYGHMLRGQAFQISSKGQKYNVHISNFLSTNNFNKSWLNHCIII